MVGGKTGARAGLRWVILALVVVFTVVAIGADPADARRRKKYRGVGYTPPYAAIVVDANTGQVLHSANADATRHPASLTKIMTLYLLFEQLEAGKLRLNSELKVSSNAASQSPSKLGVRPGQTIDVEDAILALVTKSANDVAVVIAEAIGGDEEDFAKLMTRKARALGMARTTYTNASGLPDPAQVTTARDQATLGRAVQERFPKYYAYFKTQRFRYGNRIIGNHNRLVGRVEGVDGIKTGYIRASGFNLVSSMKRDGRHIVAVVLGGSSGRTRDARMRTLLEGHIEEASLRRTAPKLIEVAEAARTRVAVAAPTEVRAKPEPVGRPMALAAMPTPKPGSADPIKPIMVKTVSVRRGSAPAATATGQAVQALAAERTVASAGTRVALASASHDRPSSSRPHVKGDWVIQVGAFPAESLAHDRLKEAQSMGRTVLTRAAPFTERVVKGDTTLYRARFAGFDRDAAEAACNYFKRNEIACLALKN
jgi:D-alanyl-D-alanine carboxypeptidase